MGQAKDLLEQAYRALNAHDAAALAALYSDSAEVFGPGGMQVRGGEAVAQFATVYLTAFPDCQWSVTNVIEGGDSAAIETVFHGTHTGPLRTPNGEVPATGRKVVNEVANIGRVEGGKLVFERVYFDQMGLMMQLGLSPEAQPAG